METLDFKITFINIGPRQAGRLAGELKDTLLDVDPDVHVKQIRERPDTMDMGSVLQVMSGSALLAQVIKSFEVWLLKRRNVAFEVSDGTRTLKISGVSEKTAMAKLEAFLKEGQASKDTEDA